MHFLFHHVGPCSATPSMRKPWKVSADTDLASALAAPSTVRNQNVLAALMFVNQVEIDMDEDL
jgi:hypothetical protein